LEREVEIPYGSKICRVRLGKGRLLRILKPKPASPLGSLEEALERFFENPIGSKTFGKLCEGRKKAVVVVDDHTRPVPTRTFLPLLLLRLKRHGLKEALILVATGIHNPPSERQLEKMLGSDFPLEVSVQIHNPDENLVWLGETSFGNKVYLNADFMEADLKILTGDISLHYFAGYGGSRKSVLPGVAGRETIAFNHRMSLHPKAEGGVLKGNPVHEDMMEAARMAKVDVSLNVVLNEERRIAGVFAGDLEKAFLEGVKFFDRIYRVEAPPPADIVIVSPGGAPSDLDLVQSVKALHTASRLVKPGGVIVFAAECPEGYGSTTFYEWSKEAEKASDILERLKREYSLGGHIAYFTLRDTEKAKVILVSKLPSREVEEVFKMMPAGSLEEALEEAFKLKGENASVTVIPKGSSLLPTFKF